MNPTQIYQPLLTVIIILVIMISIFYFKKGLVIRFYTKLRLNFYLKKMNLYSRIGSTSKVLYFFEKAKEDYEDIHGKYPSNKFWTSNLSSIDPYLRMYILMDTVERKIDDGKTDKTKNLIRTINNLHGKLSKQDKDLMKKIDKKANEINSKLKDEDVSSMLKVSTPDKYEEVENHQDDEES